MGYCGALWRYLLIYVFQFRKILIMDEQRKSAALKEWDNIRSKVSSQLLENPNNFEILGDQSRLGSSEFEEYKQAAHAFIWAHDDRQIWGYDCKAAILVGILLPSISLQLQYISF
jgi:hypothetical protein